MGFNTIKEKKIDSANYMVEEITKVIKTFGKRDPGSKGETDAVNYMAEQCKELGCDNVKIEAFDLHPSAFMGWIYITVTNVLVAFGLYFVSVIYSNIWAKIAALVLIAVGALIMLGEFIMYREIVDKIYPKKTSHNLVATKKPTGDVQRRIFFNGHPDAADEWTFNYLFGGVGFGLHFIISIIGLVYIVGIFVVSFFIKNNDLLLKLGYGGFAFMPFFLGMYILWNERRIVDGANDNLTGCYMGIALLKALKENNVELEHTEVGVLITGSEEAGLRGAKAFCKAHAGEYKDVETLIFAYDTIHEGKFLCVNKKDLNSTVTADLHASELFKNAADKIGITCSYGSVPLGATDSAAFNQMGFKATGITAMDHNLKNYYHTRRDTYDNLDTQCLADCFTVTVQALEDFDSGK